MKIESIGSFLPNEILIDARKKFCKGLLDDRRLADIENRAVKDIVERQIACGLLYVTSGKLRRNHGTKDFWYGLNGISREDTTSKYVNPPAEDTRDMLHLTGRIAYNPDHPFFKDLIFLHKTVAGRALCRQSLPSPANLLLEIFNLSNGHPERLYTNLDTLVADISDAYRLTVWRLYELGCVSILFDDTACGLMCDDNFTKRLLLGGVDIIRLHRLIIEAINASVADLPDGMETAIYLSGGDNVVPEWEFINYPDNIMPSVLKELNMTKFFLPFDTDNDYSLEILRHVPKGRKVVLGLTEAHSPFSDNTSAISSTILKAMRHIESDCLYISPKTGFMLSNYACRGLTAEDQWRKLSELATFSKWMNTCTDDTRI